MKPARPYNLTMKPLLSGGKRTILGRVLLLLKADESRKIAAFRAVQGPGVRTLVGIACAVTSFPQLSIIMPIWFYSL